MSSKKRNDNTFLVWDEMVAEASIPPLKMTLPDGETVIIEQPTGERSMEAEELARSGGGTSRDQLRVVLGDEAWEQMEPLILAGPANAAANLVVKVMKHFGISAGDVGEEVSPS